MNASLADYPISSVRWTPLWVSDRNKSHAHVAAEEGGGLLEDVQAGCAVTATRAAALVHADPIAGSLPQLRHSGECLSEGGQADEPFALIY
jgi:hypothetical protein